MPATENNGFEPLPVIQPLLFGSYVVPFQEGRMTELDHLMATALNLAEVAAELSARAWRSDLAVSYKPDGSSLTESDLNIEALWRERIRQQYPSHGILGEEQHVLR